jgi:hypothetical protein
MLDRKIPLASATPSKSFRSRPSINPSIARAFVPPCDKQTERVGRDQP